MYVFGRDRSCDFVLKHASISRQHAALVFHKDGGYWLIDLKSTHKTFIGGKPIKPKEPVKIPKGVKFWFGESTRSYIIDLGDEDFEEPPRKVSSSSSSSGSSGSKSEASQRRYASCVGSSSSSIPKKREEEKGRAKKARSPSRSPSSSSSSRSSRSRSRSRSRSGSSSCPRSRSKSRSSSRGRSNSPGKKASELNEDSSDSHNRFFLFVCFSIFPDCRMYI